MYLACGQMSVDVIQLVECRPEVRYLTRPRGVIEHTSRMSSYGIGTLYVTYLKVL